MTAVFSLSCCGKSEVEDAKKELQETQEKYGWVEEETVDVSVAKFNTQVADNSSLNPASTDYLTESDGQYWYGLIEGIYLAAVPKEYTGDKAADITDYMLIHAEKNGKYESDALSYTKYLIKANNSQLTDLEIDNLLAEAREKSASGKMANNGKGISVGYSENDGIYQYRVVRLYK